METQLQKDALTVIFNRKSVRNYTGEVVRKNDILLLLKAAMAAPAAKHLLPWKFIVVTDKESLEKLENGLPYAKMLTQAGTAIVVCAHPTEAAMGSEAYAILDCACASQNLLLAAESLGLGAVWTAVYPDRNNMDFVRRQLGIPETVIPLNIIPIGYPTLEDKAQEKYDAKSVCWEKWSI